MAEGDDRGDQPAGGGRGVELARRLALFDEPGEPGRITRLGNVPINGRIKEWAVTSAPADHAGILNRWEAFNYARTAAAFAAFALLILLTLRRDEPVRHPTSRR
ncbi:anthrone oxygenase family protein [Streptomyces exfoliatus]|uniref:anthrone oxygenase family protein n=1 Tax=Streptomyces exfoliatus TaxID=1905 RepID=UPI0037B602AD